MIFVAYSISMIDEIAVHFSTVIILVQQDNTVKLAVYNFQEKVHLRYAQFPSICGSEECRITRIPLSN